MILGITSVLMEVAPVDTAVHTATQTGTHSETQTATHTATHCNRCDFGDNFSGDGGSAGGHAE